MSQIQYWFYLSTSLALLFGMTLILIRLLNGPSLYDRILAANSFGAKIVLFQCMFGFIVGRSDGVDLAILYALINFIATIAILKFFRYRTLGVALAQMDRDRTRRNGAQGRTGEAAAPGAARADANPAERGAS